MIKVKAINKDKAGADAAKPTSQRFRTPSKRQSSDASAAIKKWTLILYHSGDADLGEEFIWALKEMARVGTAAWVEVVALVDSLSPDPWMVTIPSGTATRLPAALPSTTALEEAKAPIPEEAPLFHNTKVLIKEAVPKEWTQPDAKPSAAADSPLEEVNLASATLLCNFVSHCVRAHPADHYMLILSGHGAGMIGTTFLLDQGAERYMSVPRLSWALQEIAKEVLRVANTAMASSGNKRSDGRIDILGLDSCAMLTAEVGYLLKEEVQYLVASEGFMQLNGWPYHLLLEYLKDTPSATPEALAKETVRRCVRYYADFARVGLSVEMAAVQSQQVRRGKSNAYPQWWALTRDMRTLTNTLRAAVRATAGRKSLAIRNAVIAAHWYAQSYALEQYVDLHDFCEQLAAAAPSLKEQCAAVIAALDCIVVASAYTGAESQHSHGLSLYFPWNAADADLWRYSRYIKKDKNGKPLEAALARFNEKTGWGEFLWEFIYATRRNPRAGKGRLIFMPPLGYLDHLNDYYADPQKRPGGKDQPPPTDRPRQLSVMREFRTNPPIRVKLNPPIRVKLNPPIRVKLNGQGSAFSQVSFKNPALIFFENLSENQEDDRQGKKAGDE